MRIFVCEALLENLNVNIIKIQEAFNEVNNKNYEAFFIYSFGLFESAVCEIIRHILTIFPEKILREKFPKLKLVDIYNNISSPQYILYTLVDAEVKSIRKGDAKSLLDEAKNICSIEINYDEKLLYNISKQRNKLIHENTIQSNNIFWVKGTLESLILILKNAKLILYFYLIF